MPSIRPPRPRIIAALSTVALVGGTLVAGAASAHPAHDPATYDRPAHNQTAQNPAPGHALHDGRNPGQKQWVAEGRGGAVSSVDADATKIGIDVLRRGGNATDAAVATAAALGVTEPYSLGLGGGGFFVHYDAARDTVETIDGRETAPQAMPHDAFIDPDTGQPYEFFPDMVTSGAAVGVPGTPATWEAALESWGSRSLGDLLEPAADLAERGFDVDRTFHEMTVENQERFAAIPPTAELFLPGGQAPPVGSTFRNPDLADTYRLIADEGMDAFYEGALADEIADTVQNPPVTDGTDLPVPPGEMTSDDIADYEVRTPEPTRHDYRGYEVVGMAPPSSGGHTAGETLNILEQFDLAAMPAPAALHHYLEASALAYADRAAYSGDPEFVDVPTGELLSDEFAAERACRIDPDTAAEKPVPSGDADGDYDPACDGSTGPSADRPDTEGPSTTHLSVTDRWGNVVSYTLTIEQTGGSGITVPGRGFLLNNELTDFSHVYDDTDPNRIEGGKRPRSSMTPTIVFAEGKPWLAVGSPGGSTIITTVTQTLLNRIDLGMDLPDAVAAPRAYQHNTATVTAEPAFADAYGDQLAQRGHELGETSSIGVVAAIELLPDGRAQAVAEPERHGGGSAAVVHPTRR
ncbi:gamma-glutamyltransferase [Prauserella rugosa]|uniref:Glutathione hydrolase proenzyme n=1 Tax=Prauserella rugosa TaxID=43354 RepID=A0A660CGB3_9PSEU|nr:gamma-glutamyltransferase [Prauserella rugosa]KMS90121.1 gamma-glutamyltransferase [Streptomyces regensis]TWH20041.1 gamma-glutamyltranspeptidase/glutathione hydrolase [Prauserella rugosa]